MENIHPRSCVTKLDIYINIGPLAHSLVKSNISLKYRLEGLAQCCRCRISGKLSLFLIIILKKNVAY